MKKTIWTFAFTLLSCTAYAIEITPTPPLDQVLFNVSAKQWINTQTGLLSVTINATLSNTDLIKVRTEIMSGLNNIAKGEWHLTQFERAQDNSGLEKLTVVAQARLSQADLTNVYQLAKNMSKPGLNYQINDMQFKPSFEEIQEAKKTLRTQLYQKVNEELGRLNQAYPEQHYTLNRLIFTDSNSPPRPMPQAREGNTMAMLAMTAEPALSVSDELTMSATVEAASNRQPQQEKPGVTKN